MNKGRIIGLILGALFCLLLFSFFWIMSNATNNCQEYKTVCYRSELNWAGFNAMETQCKNNWDFQRTRCIDKGYFWEDLNDK